MNSLTALGAAALLIRIGFALYVAGLVRAKNVAGTILSILCDLCVATLAFWAIGAAILFRALPGDQHSFFWIEPRILLGAAELRGDVLFFYLAMVLSASGIVCAAVSERFKFLPLCGASALLAGVIFPIAAHWATPGGWLFQHNFIDLGGATVFHVSAAVCAAVGAIIVGPRGGKFNRDGSSTMIHGHNVPFALIGAMLMLVGFVPYVAGALLLRLGDIPLIMGNPAQINEVVGEGARNVLLSAAAAGLGGMILSHFRYRKIDIGVVLLGFLGGVVASSSANNAISTQAAVVTGLVAGFIVPWAAIALDLRLRIDDPAGVIAVHGVGGAWGTIAVALFSTMKSGLGQTPQNISSLRLRFLMWQIIGIVAIAAMSAIFSTALFLTLKKTIGIRSREADEFDGLDLAEHDIGAYPDFQQNTIKSYHLREA
jgi:Amt family ammonium transporter